MNRLIINTRMLLRSVLAAILMLPIMPVFAETTIEDRVESVEKLLDVSSAAKKVEASNNDAAKIKHNEARLLFRQAKDQQAQGNINEAEKYLTLTTKTLFEAVRLVDKDQSIIDKQHRDYVMRLDSINALAQAYERIRDEKGLATTKDSELYPFVQSKLKSAKIQEENGNYIEGRQILDEAYIAAKVAIEHVRGGDTLVRSLDFATNEDEYAYEIDRNDTHKMLVNVLLKEKMSGNKQIETMVGKHMEVAAKLRKQAEGEAAGGHYEKAVQTLEQSTREIVRAIRTAGIYIPG